jgi:hypothetical protein
MNRADKEAIPETASLAATPAIPEEQLTSGRRRRQGVAADGAPLSGAALLQQQAPTLPNRPGVYRMLDAKGEVLYVGKAKSLRKRIPAYAKPAGLSARLQRMVTLTRATSRRCCSNAT